MTKHQAWQKAHAMWDGPDRYGCVVLRQKKHPKRYQVGWQRRVVGFETPAPWTMMGAGDTWEEAFEDAKARGTRSALAEGGTP